ncbi:MAG: hypothetical protein QXM86_00165 [Candidatus Bathyarchaeia archaeon]
MPDAKEKRIQRKINELGTRKLKCAICGEEDIFALRKADKSLLEEHHIAAGHEGASIIVCRNCHLKLTDSQLDWPVGLTDKEKTPEMRAVAFFMGLAGILSLLAFWCIKHAKVLYDFIVKKQ